jgi:phage/plasmid-associated DNA primase
MATGGDGMHVERKYEHGRDIDARFALWVAANRWPQVYDADGALRRRAAIFRLRRPIVGASVDDYSRRLVETEGPAILAQLFRWRADYLLNGLYWSAEMNETRDEYFNTSDRIRNFLLDECQFDSDGLVHKTELYNRYRGWYQQAGHKNPLARNEFFRQLGTHPLFVEHRCEFDKVRLTPGRGSIPQHSVVGLRMNGFDVLSDGTQ